MRLKAAGRLGPIKVNWQKEARTPALAMLGRLRDQWTADSIAGSLFSRWDFSSQPFSIIDLQDFKLGGAKLREADLSGAGLIGANLSRANLIEADLSGAGLSGANLIGADCSRLNIDSARLQSADHSAAVNLTQEQIDRAKGNSRTKLPDGTDRLERPAHWLEDS